MRILLFRLVFIHQKNLDGFEAMCKSIGAELSIRTMVTLEERVEHWDLIWIPIGLVDPKLLPGAKRIVLGPHNFVFPEGHWQCRFKSPRTFYNCLSSWNRNVYYTMGGVGDLKLACLPFPVDTDSFAPSGEKTHDCFLYTKLRRPEDIDYTIKALTELGLTYKCINYGSYTEKDYKGVLATCRFGVWVGRHESQGFALQEALSSGVPLVVWDVETMGEEWDGRQIYTGEQGDFKATSAPYWDARCGVKVRKENLKEGLRFMRGSWAIHRPREFIMETLSAKACATLWRQKLKWG